VSDYTKEEIEFAFKSFARKSDEMVQAYYRDQFSNLITERVDVQPGRVYWKMVKGTEDRGWTVFGFVRKSDGAIFKAASWKQPFVKGPSAIRGYVTDFSNGMDSVTPYGVKYAN